MTFEEYAAQNAQSAQQPQQAQEVLTAEQMRAKLDAERLSFLVAEAQAAIEGKTDPAAMLQTITGAIFGTSSQQAAAVAAAIDADKHPGGHEWAIADIRQRRKLLKQQGQQLEAQLKAIADELDRLDDAERALIRERADAAALDSSLIETLTFCKCLDAQPEMLGQLETLYNRHKSNRPAMGLLYGCIADLTRKQFDAGCLDLIQQRDFIDLQKRIEAAAFK